MWNSAVIDPSRSSWGKNITFTTGPAKRRCPLFPAAARMSTRPHRWCRNAPIRSACTRRTSDATVSPWPSTIGSGTTLTKTPPDRRNTAVVRPETGILTMTSSLPVIRARYIPNAAITTAAGVASSRVAE
ncbi:hypothetical protein GCM10011610_04100 [Nocardia rhizosphaerihabitans]|uniref:Uncharacterized protein n=1 Tax=Nocardia rhizosphaerihabitans TaxID=1691570 RepID=A0ABQ2K686_9NOCA|nr:hypothetical protein GCM10011610_04100 [Nocardia rhizosphaerihabitans]